MAPGEHDDKSAAAASRLGFSVGRDHVSFDVDETVYPLDAVYGASYLFVDRCFVFLSRPSPQAVNVRLTSRGSATTAELDALGGEFANELLSQAARLRLSQATSRLREYYTAAALRAAARRTRTIVSCNAKLQTEFSINSRSPPVTAPTPATTSSPERSSAISA